MKDRASKQNNQLVHTLAGETMAIEPWGRDGLRVRVTRNAELIDTAWALTVPVNSSAAIDIRNTEAVIRNGKISARIHDIRTQKGRLQFFRHGDGQSDGGTTCILSENDYVVTAHNPGTRIFKSLGSGLHHSELHFAPREGERLYGMGLNATGSLDLKGCVIDLYQRHVKQVVPFVVSSEGYGLLWNNPSLGRVEFGQNLTRWVSYGCRQMDYYITAGDSWSDILANYTDVTGHAPDFPAWAAGFWQCKNRYKSQEEFLNIARGFKQRDLPVSVLVIDYLHWARTGDWKLDPALWPDPEAMVRELDEMGARIMVSPWTVVDETSENFEYMKSRGLFTGSIDGTKDTVAGPGPAAEKRQKYQYDPTNPEAARFLWSKWKENYFDIGIRTFWLDPCDDLHEIADYDQALFHIGPALEAHAYFPIAHQKNIYDGLLAAGENEVVTICRNAWAGSQRYGASPAAHDIESSFEHLDTYMKAGLNLAMSGIPWGAAEIGGYVTDDYDSDYFRELIVRWYQYGVFTPIFRTHGYRGRNEPWAFGGDTYTHIRAAIMLRERLRPYIMAQMTLATNSGLPPMRPLFFDFADDPEVAQIEDQFLFGSDLLIAPITAYRARSRDVYLPAGTTWTDAWTGQSLAGGELVTAQSQIERIPVYLRGDNPDLLALFNSASF